MRILADQDVYKITLDRLTAWGSLPLPLPEPKPYKVSANGLEATFEKDWWNEI